MEFVESPFRNGIDRKRKIYITTRDTLERQLPFLRDLPRKHFFFIAATIIFATSLIFSIIFYIGFTNTKNTTYLTPSNGIDEGRYCELVSTTNTGVYYATKSGYWQNSPNFLYSNASFIAYITSLQITINEYKSLMMLIYGAISTIGQQALQQDLSLNLVQWMTLNFYVPTLKSQRFYLTGEPKVVFKRQYQAGSVGNAQFVCNISSFASFDSSSGTLTLSYNYNEYIQAQQCNETIAPELFGFLPNLGSDAFNIQFDVQTLITAVAINLQIITIDQIIEIPELTNVYEYGGKLYPVSSYYLPKFPNMDPVTCIVSDNNSSLCILSIGGVLGIPVFNHMGSSKTLPEPCNCSALHSSDESSLQNPYFNCNLFSFLSGFIFYPNSTYFPNDLFELGIKYNYDYKQINQLAYNASYINSYWGQTSSAKSQLQSTAFRQQAFDFCTLFNNDSCTMLTFSSFDGIYQPNWAISDYYYQVQNGACQDSFTPTLNEWENLIDSPFAPLNQNYAECRYSSTVNLVTQTGITLGNMSIVAPVCAFIVVFVYYLFGTVLRSYKHEDRVYSRAEIDKASQALSYALLLARDHKLSSSSSQSISIPSSFSKIIDIAKELESIAKEASATQERVLSSSSEKTDNPLGAIADDDNESCFSN